jgi:D-alanine-D-alanine ligase
MRKIPFHKSIIAVDIYDPILPTHWTAEWESWESIEILKDTLIELGHEVEIITLDENLIHILSNISEFNLSKTLVWNLVEGFQSRNRESYIPSICEFYGIAHSGSDAYTQILTLDKKLTKNIAKSLNIPVPIDYHIDELKNNDTFNNKKYFIKPRFEGSSLGVTEASLITEKLDLERYLREMKTSGIQDFIIEDYLEGEDLTIGIFSKENQIFSTKLGKVIFNGLVYSQKIKSKYGEYETISYEDIPEEIEEKIKKYSIQLAKELGVIGYARVDWKLNHKKEPFLLEVNSTPGLSSIYSLLPILYKDTFNKSYSDMIQDIIQESYFEYQNNKRYQYGKRKHNVF